MHHGWRRQVGAASASEPPTLRDQQGAEQQIQQQISSCSLSLPWCQRVASAPTPTWRPHGGSKHRSPARVLGLCLLPWSLSLPGCQRVASAPTPTWRPHGRCKHRSPARVVGRQRQPPSRGDPRTGPTGNSGAGSRRQPSRAAPRRALADLARPGALSRTRAALAPQKDLGNPRLHHRRQRQVGAASASEPPTLRDQQGAEQQTGSRATIK